MGETDSLKSKAWDAARAWLDKREEDIIMRHLTGNYDQLERCLDPIFAQAKNVPRAIYVPPTHEDLRADMVVYGVDKGKGPDLTGNASFSGGTCTSAPAPAKPFSLDDLLEAMDTAKRKINEACGATGHMLLPFPDRFVESPLCTATVPNRKHKKRRNQTEAYHRRVQKKWTKRWGTHEAPAAWVIDSSIVSPLSVRWPECGFDRVLVLHTDAAAALRRRAW